MTRNTHCLVGVVELPTERNLKALEPQLDEPVLSAALHGDAPCQSETSLAADLPQLCDDLRRQYQQFVGSGSDRELLFH